MESSYEILRTKLDAHRKHWGRICELSGLSRSTFNKIAYGQVKSPGVDKVDAINRGLEQFLFGTRQ